MYSQLGKHNGGQIAPENGGLNRRFMITSRAKNTIRP